MLDETRISIPPLTADNVAERAAWAREHTLTPWVAQQTLREDRADGTILLHSPIALPQIARNSGVWLHHWAARSPDRVALRERVVPSDPQSLWHEMSYSQVLRQVQAIASWLLAQGYGPQDRIAILSGNGLDHQLLSLAAQYIGIPTAPLAEQYSLLPNAHERLVSILDRLKPRLLYVDQAAPYAAALMLEPLRHIPVLASKTAQAPREVISFATALLAPHHPDLAAAHAAVGPETLAKILFTSGSTSEPKGVLTTQGMICANQAQMAAVMPLLSEQPPRVTDWLPWNHVFGGSHNVYMVLANGGTLTIDHGKPTQNGFALTLANRRAYPGTLAFNVPIGFDMLSDAAKQDPDTAQRLFGELELVFYAGASLSQELWTGLERLSLGARDGLPLMISSWGLTETSPACLMVHEPIGRSGVIGVPLPGVEVKLIPDDDMRCEIRIKGPNVFAGYLDAPDKTREAFDEEGYFITGDAVRFVDATDPSRGLIFDGRVTEDFKLATGTWVQASMLRMRLLAALGDLVQDLVICGHDRSDMGLMIFPRAQYIAQQAGLIDDAALIAAITAKITAYNAGVSGSAKRVARALVLAEPPSVDGHEVTDKGSLNARKILQRRATLLDALYDKDAAGVIRF